MTETEWISCQMPTHRTRTGGNKVLLGMLLDWIARSLPSCGLLTAISNKRRVPNSAGPVQAQSISEIGRDAVRTKTHLLFRCVQFFACDCLLQTYLRGYDRATCHEAAAKSSYVSCMYAYSWTLMYDLLYQILLYFAVFCCILLHT